jgi:3-deoxy-D-manno-octulosonic-acid transferase
VVGPFAASFGDLYADLVAAGGAVRLADASAGALGLAVAGLLGDAGRGQAMAEAAAPIFAGGQAAMTRTLDALEALLPLSTAGRS